MLTEGVLTEGAHSGIKGVAHAAGPWRVMANNVESVAWEFAWSRAGDGGRVLERISPRRILVWIP